jgi:hypothetical protein
MAHAEHRTGRALALTSGIGPDSVLDALAPLARAEEAEWVP